MQSLEEQRQGLLIDKHNLDEELIRQPQRYMSVAENYALAVSKRDLEKENVKKIESQISLSIRNEKRDSKITESGIVSIVQGHPDRVAAVEKLIRAEREVIEWQSLKEAFNQRAYVLRELASLYISGYYSQNGVGGVRSEVEQKDLEYNRARISQVRNRVNAGG